MSTKPWEVHTTIVRLLLERGADPNLEFKWRDILLPYGVWDTDIMGMATTTNHGGGKVIEQSYIKTKYIGFSVPSDLRSSIAKQLVTPLIYSVRRPRKSKIVQMGIVKALLDAGANRSDPDRTGWRAIDYARRAEAHEIVELLEN